MPFEKGQSGNPGGKPQNKQFWDAIQRAIAQDKSERLRNAAEKLLDKAAEGESWAINALADRLDGKPAQALTNAEGGPVAIVFMDSDKEA